MAVGMKQHPVGESIAAPIDSSHDVMAMPSCEGGNLLMADRTETLLFSPEIEQLSSPCELAGHLEPQTLLKVLLPGGVIRIGFPVNFDVALDLGPGRTPQAYLQARLSLSRLNHRLPRIQAHPEVVQGTAELHHQITDPLLPQADPVFHNAAALDTAIDMLNAQPPLVERLVRPLLLPRELLATRFLGRHEDGHLRERERQEPQILQESAPRRQGIRRRVRNGLIMGAAAIGVAQKEDEEQGID